jgi:NADPH:quinone reductase-like Zn-dependent oxidoreductase
VGTFAVQIAGALGAKVTAVCSTRNVEMVRSLGAGHVFDYTREDFTLSGPYDVVLDLVGNRSLGELRRTLTPTGTLVLSSGPPSPTIRRLLKALVITPFIGQRMTSFVQTQSTEDLDYLTTLIEAGTVVPVLDRINTLSEAGDALRYQGEGHARGRTIITVPTPRVPEEQRE